MRIIWCGFILVVAIAIGCGKGDEKKSEENSDTDVDTGLTARCGNNSCEPGEGCTSCPEDCGKWRDLECGNGVCLSEACETCANCPKDCGQCQPSTCGNGVCEPGEDAKCADCASLLSGSTCNQACKSSCDCLQPWTACGVGINSRCLPVACEACYSQSLSCCWCPSESCSNVTCQPDGVACPSC
jgi:hypothetical protein